MTTKPATDAEVDEISAAVEQFQDIDFIDAGKLLDRLDAAEIDAASWQRTAERLTARLATARADALEEVLALPRYGTDGFDNISKSKDGWLIHEDAIRALKEKTP